MLDQLPSPVHPFSYPPYHLPTRPRNSFLAAYLPNKLAGRSSVSPDPDPPFAFTAPRDGDPDTRPYAQRTSSQSPTLSPPPLSASSSGTHPSSDTSLPQFSYEQQRTGYAEPTPDYDPIPSGTALVPPRLPSMLTGPFTVSPLTSPSQSQSAHPQSLPSAYSSHASLDRRLSEPTLRSLYTVQPHPSVHPNQLPRVHKPVGYSPSPASTIVPATPLSPARPPTSSLAYPSFPQYGHQRTGSDGSAASYGEPWGSHSQEQKYAPDELTQTAAAIALDPFDGGQEASLSPDSLPYPHETAEREQQPFPMPGEDAAIRGDDKEGEMFSPGREGKDKKTYSFVSLPGNQVKKRPRRRYDEIERLYQCSFPNCTKAYGTLNHLNAHVTMQKHGPKRSPAEFKELRKQWRLQKKEQEESERQRERDARQMAAAAHAAALAMSSSHHHPHSHHLHQPTHSQPQHHRPHPHMSMGGLTYSGPPAPPASFSPSRLQYPPHHNNPHPHSQHPRMSGGLPGMPGVNSSPVRLYAPPAYPHQQTPHPHHQQHQMSPPGFQMTHPHRQSVDLNVGHHPQDVYAQPQQQHNNQVYADVNAPGGMDVYSSDHGLLRRSSMSDFSGLHHSPHHPGGMEGAAGMEGEMGGVGPMRQTHARTRRMSVHPHPYANGSPLTTDPLLPSHSSQQQQQQQQQRGMYAYSNEQGTTRPPQGAGGIDMVSPSLPSASVPMGWPGQSQGQGQEGTSPQQLGYPPPSHQSQHREQGQQHDPLAMPQPSQTPAFAFSAIPHHAHTQGQQQDAASLSPPGSSHGHGQHGQGGGEMMLPPGTSRLPPNSTLLTALPGYEPAGGYSHAHTQEEYEEYERSRSRPGTGRSEGSVGVGHGMGMGMPTGIGGVQGEYEATTYVRTGGWREREDF